MSHARPSAYEHAPPPLTALDHEIAPPAPRPSSAIALLAAAALATFVFACGVLAGQAWG